MNWTPSAEEKKQIKDNRPAWHAWAPLARELSERPTAARFKNFRLADNFRNDYVQPQPLLDPVQQAVLGRHDFQKIQRGASGLDSKDSKESKESKTPKKSQSPMKAGSPFATGSPATKTPKRRNIIFTA